MKFAFIDKKSTQPEKVIAYAEKKVGKLDRYFNADAEATVRFQEKKRNQVKIELTEGQIRKNKTRLAKRLRSDAFDPAELAAPAVEEKEEHLEVVRAKKFLLAPMGVEEAIMQMNLLGHTFFAFRNDDDGGAFAVVYAREDGGYGLIVDTDPAE